MTFVPVEKIPEKSWVSKYDRAENKRTRVYLEEFMKMGVKYALVDVMYDEYSSMESCEATLRQCVKRQGYPIDVKTRDGEVYLARRDI